jgi:hypothetical protein
VKFSSSLNHHTSKATIQEVIIGMPTIFSCPPHTKVVAGISYKWGNRYDNSSYDYDIKSSKRVWITARGELLFHEFRLTDATLIKTRRIRCIIEQRTSSGLTIVISNIFDVSLQSKSSLYSAPPYNMQFSPPCNIRDFSKRMRDK